MIISKKQQLVMYDTDTKDSLISVYDYYTKNIPNSEMNLI